MRFIFLLIILSFNPVYSQNKFTNDISNSHSIALLSSVERNDIYTSLTYLNTTNSFSYAPSIGVGVIHSIFQKNPLIRAGCSVYYNWINVKYESSKDFIFGTGLGCYYSFYNEPIRTNFYDIKLGYMMQYGNRFKIIHNVSFGFLKESFVGNTKSIVLNYPNLTFSMGFAYEF